MSQAEARRASAERAWDWDVHEPRPRPLARRAAWLADERPASEAAGFAEVHELRPGAGVEGRRTVRISGQAAAPPRTRAAQRPARRSRGVARPDRFAAWAVVLGLFMAALAAATAHAETPAGAQHAPAAHVATR